MTFPEDDEAGDGGNKDGTSGDKGGNQIGSNGASDKPTNQNKGIGETGKRRRQVKTHELTAVITTMHMSKKL